MSADTAGKYRGRYCNRDADTAAGYGFYLQYTSRIQSGGGKNRIRWRTYSNGY